MRLRAPGCGWGVVVISAAALLLLAALGLALALLLTRESLQITMKNKYLKLIWRRYFRSGAFINSGSVLTAVLLCVLSCKFHPVSLFSAHGLEIKGQAVEEQLLSTSPPDLLSAGNGVSHTLPTISANRSQLDSTTAPQPARSPPSETRKRYRPNGHLYSNFHIHELKILAPFFLCNCNKAFLSFLSGCGGVLTDPEGSFSSPNHPGSYPPNLLCVWVLRVPPPSVIQIHVSSLTVEGPSPCLFDWLEVQEQIEHNSVVTRSVRPKLSLWVKYIEMRDSTQIYLYAGLNQSIMWN